LRWILSRRFHFSFFWAKFQVFLKCFCRFNCGFRVDCRLNLGGLLF
jgi:hypothetical protein